MNFFETVGKNILEVLLEKNISQTELAEKIGVSKQVMGKIVKGQKAINALEIKKISEALEINMERLLEEKEDLVEEPVLMFMGKVKEQSKEDIKFLSSVIGEIISMEEALDD
ncbi:MAG: helix-turn-helix transcriptional regulator [Clostridiaceae bacterium]